MKYCQRCVYPENAKPTIIFDDEGICSGCRLLESRPAIDWEERGKWLKELAEKYKAIARSNNNPYDCIIPISGGKDSHYQTYFIKNILGMNPLLVTYNHGFNTKRGLRNLNNNVKQFGCDLLRFTSNPSSVRKISKYMLKKCGDVTWHYHAGILTFPIQAAVMYKIPLIVWGEIAFGESVGMFNQDDMVEFTKKHRQEHSLRGFEPEDILKDHDNKEITMQDLAPFYYPKDEIIEKIGLHGIYLGNYISWNGRKQTDFIIEKYGFETAVKRDRTFNLHDKLDDIHANGTHDYLKYLKFGYGRCTDDASTEIRHGRMTREEGISMVAKYDHVRPKDLDIYLRFIGMTEKEFLDSIEHLRDRRIWEKTEDGSWKIKDSVSNHVHDHNVEKARLKNVQPWKPFEPKNQIPSNIKQGVPVEEEQDDYLWL